MIAREKEVVVRRRSYKGEGVAAIGEKVIAREEGDARRNGWLQKGKIILGEKLVVAREELWLQVGKR